MPRVGCLVCIAVPVAVAVTVRQGSGVVAPLSLGSLGAARGRSLLTSSDWLSNGRLMSSLSPLFPVGPRSIWHAYGMPRDYRALG